MITPGPPPPLSLARVALAVDSSLQALLDRGSEASLAASCQCVLSPLCEALQDGLPRAPLGDAVRAPPKGGRIQWSTNSWHSHRLCQLVRIPCRDWLGFQALGLQLGPSLGAPRARQKLSSQKATCGGSFGAVGARQGSLQAPHRIRTGLWGIDRGPDRQTLTELPCQR